MGFAAVCGKRVSEDNVNATTFSLLEPAPMPPNMVRPVAAEFHATAVMTQFDIITTRAGFDALEADWAALFARSGRGDQMFQSFNWLWHWANHYLDASDELTIVTARRDGRLVLVMPFMIERTARLRQLAFMGAPVSQYGDVVVEDMADRAALLAAAWSHLRASVAFDMVRLIKVRADAAIVPLLQSSGFAVTATEEAPSINLKALSSYAQIDQNFSTKHRKNRRRQLRRLEERGPLEIKWLDDGGDARDAVRLAMTLKRAWLNHKALVSKAFKDQRIDAFFADAASSRVRPCGVAISVLSTNGEPADVNISISCKGRRAVHILAYGLKFEKFGAGNHHLEVTLQRAFDDRIETYDFLAPRHEYKMEWADTVIEVSDYALPLSPLGRLYVDVYVARVREGLKRAIQSMPPRVRRLISGAHRTV